MVLPNGALHVDIFLPAKIRSPDWLVITKDEFLEKLVNVRSHRKSCLADKEGYCRIRLWNTENLMELKDKESFVVQLEVNRRKTLIGCLFELKITYIDIGPCLRWKLRIVIYLQVFNLIEDDNGSK